MESQTITYSNYLFFNGRTLAFRKKELFDITNTPIHIPFNEKCKCWIIGRKQLTKLAAGRLLIKEPKVIYVSDLQWYAQVELDEVFNL